MDNKLLDWLFTTFLAGVVVFIMVSTVVFAYAFVVEFNQPDYRYKYENVTEKCWVVPRWRDPVETECTDKLIEAARS